MKEQLQELLDYVEKKYSEADKEIDQTFEYETISALQFATDVLESIRDKLKELLNNCEGE